MYDPDCQSEEEDLEDDLAVDLSGSDFMDFMDELTDSESAATTSSEEEGAQAPSYPCTKCGRTFKTKAGRRDHNNPLKCGAEGTMKGEESYRLQYLPDQWTQKHMDKVRMLKAKRERLKQLKSARAIVYFLLLIPLLEANAPDFELKSYHSQVHEGRKELLVYVGKSNRGRPSLYHLHQTLLTCSSVGLMLKEYAAFHVLSIPCRSGGAEAAKLESYVQLSMMMRRAGVKGGRISDPYVTVPAWKNTSKGPFLQGYTTKEQLSCCHLARLKGRTLFCLQPDCPFKHQHVGGHPINERTKTKLGPFPFAGLLHVDFEALERLDFEKLGDEGVAQFSRLLENKGIGVQMRVGGGEHLRIAGDAGEPPVSSVAPPAKPCPDLKYRAHVGNLTQEEQGGEPIRSSPSPLDHMPRHKQNYGRQFNKDPHPKEFRCYGCTNEFFPSYLKLKAHHKTVHGGNVCLCGKLDTEEHRAGCPVKKSTSCSPCEKTFKDATAKREHYKKQHMDSHCPYCGKLFQKVSDMEDHFASEHPQLCPYNCSQCSEPAPNVQALNRHRAMHHPERLSCPVEGCNYKCPNESYMKHHMRDRHGDNKPRWICQEKCLNGKVCGTTFGTKGAYEGHLIRIHGKGRPYFCITCRKTFLRKDDLYRHRDNEHQDGKKYVCSCGRGFHYMKVFQVHNCKKPQVPSSCNVCQDKQKGNRGPEFHNTDPLGCGFVGTELAEEEEEGADCMKLKSKGNGTDSHSSAHLKALKAQAKRSINLRKKRGYVYILLLVPKGALKPGMSLRDWFRGGSGSKAVLERLFYVGVSTKPQPSPYHLDWMLQTKSSVGQRMEEYDVYLIRIIKCRDYADALLLESKLQVHISLRHQLLTQYVREKELSGETVHREKIIIPIPVWKCLAAAPFLMECSEEEWEFMFELARIWERDPICLEDCVIGTPHPLPRPFLDKLRGCAWEDNLVSSTYRALIHINWAGVLKLARNELGRGQVHRLVYLLELNGYVAVRQECGEDEEGVDDEDENALPGYEEEEEEEMGNDDSLVTPTTNALWDALKDLGPSPLRHPVLRVADGNLACFSRKGAVMARRINLTDGNGTEPVFLMGDAEGLRMKVFELREAALLRLNEYEVVAHGERSFILIRDYEILGGSDEEVGGVLSVVQAKEVHPDVEEAITYDHEVGWQRIADIVSIPAPQPMPDLEEELVDKLSTHSIQRMMEGDGGIKDVDLLILDLKWSKKGERCSLSLTDGVDKNDDVYFYPRSETRGKRLTLERGAIIRLLGYMVRFLPGSVKVLEILDFEVMEEPGLVMPGSRHGANKEAAEVIAIRKEPGANEEMAVEENASTTRRRKSLPVESSPRPPAMKIVRTDEFEIRAEEDEAAQEVESERRPDYPSEAQISDWELMDDSWVFEPWESQERPNPIRNLDLLTSRDSPPPLHVKVVYRGRLGIARNGSEYIHYHVVGLHGGSRMLLSGFGASAVYLAKTLQVGAIVSIEKPLVLSRGAGYNHLGHSLELKMDANTRIVELPA